MDYLVHAANILYLASYFGRNALRLRVCTVIAAVSLVPYFLLRGEPLWAPACWNGFFAALSGYWVVRLLRERRRRAASATHLAGAAPCPETVTFRVARMVLPASNFDPC